MIAMDPNATVKFHLASDLKKPIEVRPTFFARHLTARENRKYNQLLFAADQAGESDEADKHLIDALVMILTSWANIRAKDGAVLALTATNIDELLSMLTLTETWELVAGLVSKTRAEEQDLKKSALQSASATGPSAASAIPAGAAAAPTK